MKIKATTLLKLEEFPAENRAWLARLVGPVNDFINQSIKVLNGGITFGDNFLGVDHLYTFIYQSDAITFPLNFQWTNLKKPLSLLIVSALENDSPIIAAASWSYTQAGAVALNSVVKMTALTQDAGTKVVTGGPVSLTAGRTYNIRARITP